MHTEPSQHPGDDDAQQEPDLGEEEFGDTELDRDDTHGVADEAAERAEDAG